jgi:CTP:molybdopterin cytidylyltransferase MocA
VWPVVVVLGANADAIRPQLAGLPVLVVENEAWPEGMASSIRCGITTLQQFSRSMAGVVIAPCDQPVLSAAIVAQLVEKHGGSPDAIIAARYAGRCGAPVLFPHPRFAELQALTGEQGARVVVEAHAANVVPVDLPELAFDLDTPEQYEAWRRGESI